MLRTSFMSYCQRSIFRERLKCLFHKPKRVPSKTDHSPIHAKLLSTSRNKIVLGIETSCDDTGAAVVNENGTILGDALHSQTAVHVELGGILPTVARDLHERNIEQIVNTALRNAGVTITDLDAIAVTVKPGMALSLSVGLNYAKKLVKESRVPMIPIHHMEAHALTVRLLHKVDFPFLVLLASGGHCLLAVARDVDDFLLLGTCLDNSPGDAFEKVARKLKVKNLSQFSGKSGGVAIETLAREGDPSAFTGPNVSFKTRDCHFSFSGIRHHYELLIEKEETKQGVIGDQLLPNIADICANFQEIILQHLSVRIQRALLFCEMRNILPEKKTLVLSGGVASNGYLRDGLQNICERFNCQVVCPPPHLCTDNGIMIAWNGMEKLLAGHGTVENPESVKFTPKVPFGKDISADVIAASIKIPKRRTTQPPN